MSQSTQSYTSAPTLKPLKQFLPYLWPKGEKGLKVRVIFSFFFLILSKVATVWIPIFYKNAVDMFDGAEHLAALSVPVFFIAAYGSTRLFSVLFAEVKEVLFTKVEFNAVYKTSLKVFEHIHKLSLRFHLNRKTGGLTRLIDRGTKGIETLLRFSTFNIVPTFFEALLVVGTLCYLYGALFALLAAVSVFIYIFYTIKVTEWRARFVRKMYEADNESNNRSVDSLLNFETVKYFGNEKFEQENFSASQENYKNAAIRNKIGLSTLNTGQGVIISFAIITTLLTAAYKIKAGDMTLGDFVLINTYFIQLYVPLNLLGFAYREIKRALVEMEEMFSILRIEPEIKDRENAKEIKTAEADICFEDVHFSYEPDRQILKGISFCVPSGKKVAIVGPTGSGKSTISRLLFRFYDVDKGAIKINGEDIRDLTQSSLRHLIGIVPQDMVLFNNTIGYNISYGNPHATIIDVERVAKAANLHDFIEKLPQRYETRVGERGLKLSGGEKQRVAIARTLLKNPIIYLFDEATSSLDTQTEKSIQRNLNEISQSHTTLIIAHRLSTIVDCDEILVLKEGEIVERGSHQELLQKDGLYAQMWEKQKSGEPKASI